MKYLSLILGLIALANVAYTFVGASEATQTFLTFEVNIWLYRGIWVIFGIMCLYDFVIKTKRNKNVN